jgi:uncharacterized protein YegP (UPF0339 family)
MYFTIESASGRYRGHAYGANNRLMWWTEVYVSKAGAENAISVLKTGALSAEIYDRG